jgi:hypothetical protein
MDTSAGWTVRVVVSKMLPTVALIVEFPGLPPVASPPLLIVATEVLEEAHVTLVVRNSPILLGTRLASSKGRNSSPPKRGRYGNRADG